MEILQAVRDQPLNLQQKQEFLCAGDTSFQAAQFKTLIYAPLKGQRRSTIKWGKQLHLLMPHVEASIHMRLFEI